MGKSAYVKLKEGSTQQKISLDDVKNLLNMYIERSAKTGEQLSWEYENASFPYTVEEKSQDGTSYLYLKAVDPLYNYLIIGVGTEGEEGYVQIVLPDEDYITPGDQAKGSEFAKYLGKYLKAETHLFNDRIIYNNPRK